MFTSRLQPGQQILVAEGETLPFRQENIQHRGHAIECRINAEDPDNNFAPSPGVITTFNPPLSEGPGRIRLDTHVIAGYEIPTFYDSMICKIIAHGEDRASAIQTMTNALKAFEIKGIKTTIPLHLQILGSKIFKEGNYHTQSLADIMG